MMWNSCAQVQVARMDGVGPRRVINAEPYQPEALHKLIDGDGGLHGAVLDRLVVLHPVP